MKITITNFELEYYMNIINDPKSFRNDMSVKIPGEFGWNLRLNLKTMTERLSVYEEARNELGKRFIEEGKVENDKLKPEYMNEYYLALSEIGKQVNELEILPIKKEDCNSLALSIKEMDFLMLMIED